MARDQVTLCEWLVAHSSLWVSPFHPTFQGKHHPLRRQDLCDIVMRSEWKGFLYSACKWDCYDQALCVIFLDLLSRWVLELWLFTTRCKEFQMPVWGVALPVRGGGSLAPRSASRQTWEAWLLRLSSGLLQRLWLKNIHRRNDKRCAQSTHTTTASDELAELRDSQVKAELGNELGGQGT